MAIDQSRYVDVTSVVGGASLIPTRDLIGRFFTGNTLLPPQTFIQFISAAEVGNYFGLYSEEYLRSLFYFNWISKNATTPQTIQFARWVNIAVPPMIFPIQNNDTIASNWVPITNGSFLIKIGSTTYTVDSLDFSSIGSDLSAVATIVENGINTATEIVLSGTIANTMDTVTGLSSTANLFVGMSVTGTNIPSDTTISTITSGTAITLSNAATGSATESITFSANVTVTYSSSYGGYILELTQLPLTGTLSISIMAGGGGTDITGIGFLGWLPQSLNINGIFTPGSIWAQGSSIETIAETLTTSSSLSNNFGSFTFLTNLGLTLIQVAQAANWNDMLNVTYMYSQSVIPTNVGSWYAALNQIGGIGLTLSPTLSFQMTGTLTNTSNIVSGLLNNLNMYVGMPITDTESYLPAGTVITSLVGTTGLTLSNAATNTSTELLTFYNLEFPEQCPMMIQSATDYNGTNTVQNYEFQIFPGLTPSVTDNTDANTYDGLSINYYGQTQSAGQLINFYQRGVLFGTNIDPLDMNTYSNEQWLKAASSAAIMNLLLGLAKISANATGRSQVLATLQAVINQALLNGTISINKILTQNQILFITQITNDANAYQSVMSAGYWLDAVINSSGSPITYQVDYTLVYSKDDIVRFVQGSDILI